MKDQLVYNKRKGADNIPDGAVLIDRTTKWGNPFIMHSEQDRETVVEQYREWLMKSPEAKHLRAAIRHGELNDKKLVCWCHPKSCHGDVLQEMVQLHGLEEDML